MADRNKGIVILNTKQGTRKDLGLSLQKKGGHHIMNFLIRETQLHHCMKRQIVVTLY